MSSVQRRDGRAAADGVAAPAVKPRRCADCSKVLHWKHTRCTKCLAEHREKSRVRKQEISAAIFTPARRARLLELLAAGTALSAACHEVGVSAPHVHGFRTYDPAWGAALDQALMQGRDPKLKHGTPSSYRIHRCRCPECRRAKERTRRGVTSTQQPEPPTTRPAVSPSAPARIPVPKQQPRKATPGPPTTPYQVQQAQRNERDRARLKQLLPLLENGTPVRTVLKRFGLRASDLERMRKNLPEARQLIMDACAAGEEKRRRNAAANSPGARLDREARAVQLIVAAAATCRLLNDACRAGGASPGWVAFHFRRDDVFRQALTAATAVNPAVDLDAWLEEVTDIRWSGTRPARPRPPE